MTRLLLALMASFTAAAGSAQACRCVEPSRDAAYRRADAVADIVVASVEPVGPDGAIHVSADVSAAWKSGVPRHIQLVTESGCAFPFTAEQHAIVFVTHVAGVYATARCHGNTASAGIEPLRLWLDRRGRRVVQN